MNATHPTTPAEERHDKHERDQLQMWKYEIEERIAALEARVEAIRLSTPRQPVIHRRRHDD